MRVQAQIDLSAIKHNILQIRKLVGDTVKIMPVVKANGYGHGAVEVVRELEDAADYFAAATIEEAVEIRHSGTNKPILILGYVFPEHYTQAIVNDIDLPIFEYNSAKQLSELAKEMGKKAGIHLAVDTGMSRIGFSVCDESIRTIKKIYELPGIRIDGIFSHFATADIKDKTFARKQLAEFNEFCRKTEAEKIHIPIKHISNSAAVMEDIDCRMDMVRPGIITYGLYPSDEVDKTALNLIPAMSLTSKVVYVKTVGKGVGISYGQTFITKRETVIATVPVGYADGYPRLASNRGEVIIRGKKAPILGRVCMDQFMVDVTDIEGVCQGDKVTIFGRDGDAVVTADDVAEWADTINYEIVCGIGRRVPRIYKR